MVAIRVSHPPADQFRRSPQIYLQTLADPLPPGTALRRLVRRVHFYAGVLVAPFLAVLSGHRPGGGPRRRPGGAAHAHPTDQAG